MQTSHILALPQTEAAKADTIRVLLVSTSKHDYTTIRGQLEAVSASPFKLDWAQSFQAGMIQIARSAHDIYLIDYRLGTESGIGLLEAACPQERTEAFIVLSSTSDEAIERQAIAVGAADYLVKGSFSTKLLSHTLRYVLRRKRMEEQRIQHLIDINKAKDEFISLASHQLRTPATAVKQYIGMVLEGYVGDLNDSQRAMLETAYRSNERQLQIVSDLLKVAKVDAGRVRLTKSIVDLAALLQEVTREFSPRFEQLGQNVVFECPEHSLSAMVDKVNFRMAIENIVDNASKYSVAGKTTTIRLKKSDEQVIIQVADQGVGIKPEDQDKLFIKFSRIDNSLSNEVGGTGLGLYWAKKIVDLHDGDITVSSREGKGSTFTVALPVVSNK